MHRPFPEVVRLNQELPTVSVIVPVYGHKADLALCLSALRQQNYPSELLEILIVDNDTSNPLPEEACLGATLLREAEPGSYRSRNTGVRHSAGSVLAFTDADCEPDRNWIRNGVTCLGRTANCGLVGGSLPIGVSDPDRPNASELYESIVGFRQSDYLIREHFAATANLFTYRSVFDTVGPFNPQLRSGGDVEWGQRVFAAGYRQQFAPDAVVHHRARRSVADLMQRCRRVAGGRLQLTSHQTLAHRFEQYGRGMIQTLRHRRTFGIMKTAQVIGIAILLRLVEWTEAIRYRLGASPLR